MVDQVFTWDSTPTMHVPILIHHLHGAMDAGDAGSLAITQMLRALSTQRIATFHASYFIDYRSRRPTIDIEQWLISDLDTPEIALDLVTDYSGVPLLILHGPEPDFHWPEFNAAVIEIARRYHVRTTIGLMGMPAGIPHTRQTFVHQTATDALDLPDQPQQLVRIRTSASIDMLLQYRCGQAGMHSLNLVVGVPYYLADAEYPQGSAALIVQLSSLTQLELPLGDLEAAANQMRHQIDTQMKNSEEVSHIVHMIEKAYDANIAETDSHKNFVQDNVLTEISGEDLASKFEEFFHQQRKNQTHCDMESLFTGSVSPATTPADSRHYHQDNEKAGSCTVQDSSRSTSTMHDLPPESGLLHAEKSHQAPDSSRYVSRKLRRIQHSCASQQHDGHTSHVAPSSPRHFPSRKAQRRGTKHGHKHVLPRNED